jgi:hypothetical protein
LTNDKDLNGSTFLLALTVLYVISYETSTFNMSPWVKVKVLRATNHAAAANFQTTKQRNAHARIE